MSLTNIKTSHIATTIAEQYSKYHIETACCLSEVEARDGASSGLPAEALAKAGRMSSCATAKA